MMTEQIKYREKKKPERKFT